MNEITAVPNEIKEFSKLEDFQNSTSNFNLSEVINKLKEKFKEVNKLKQSKESYDKMGIWDKFWAKSDMEEKIKQSIFLTHELSEIQTQMSLYNIFVAKSICNHQEVLLNQSNEIKSNFEIMIKHDNKIFETLENQDIFNKVTTRLNEEMNIIQEKVKKCDENILSLTSKINEYSEKQNIQLNDIRSIKEDFKKLSNNNQNNENKKSNFINIFLVINFIISITAIILSLKK